MGKINQLERRKHPLENMAIIVVTFVACLVVVWFKAQDKWLAAVFVTAVVFGTMIPFFRLRWHYRRFWLIMTAAFLLLLVLIWLILAVLLRDRSDVSQWMAIAFAFVEASVLYYAVRALQPKLAGLPSRVVEKGF